MIGRAIRAYLANVGRRRVQRLRDVALPGLAPEQRPKPAFRGSPPPIQLANPARRSQDSLAVANVVHELADYEKPGIRLERRALRAIVAIDRLDQPDCSDLLEIGAIEPTAHEAPCRPPAEVPIRNDRAFTIDRRNRNETPKRRCTKAQSHTQPQLRLGIHQPDAGGPRRPV